MSRRVLPPNFKRKALRSSPAAIMGVIIALFSLSAATWSAAATDANLVEPGTLVDYQVASDPNDFRPSQCVANNVSVTNIAADGSGNGTGGNDLVLSDGGTTSANGGDGDDCIFATSANNIDGGDGSNDVCIGNATTIFAVNTCEHEYRL